MTMTTLVTILFVGTLCGIVAALIAGAKNRSTLGWFLGGFSFGFTVLRGFTGTHAYFRFFRSRRRPKALRAEGELSGPTALDEQ
jgi:hypothetical protein